jgi:hypothetical protein
MRDNDFINEETIREYINSSFQEKVRVNPLMVRMGIGMRDQVIKVKEFTDTAASLQAAFTRRISMVEKTPGKVDQTPS